jgi:hypothetical protein
MTADPAVRQFVWAGLLATICLIVLVTSADVGFERIRTRQFASPAAGDATEAIVPLRNVDRLVGSPVAVILRVRAGDEPTTLTIALDGARLATVEAPPRREIRVDAAGYLSSSSPHELVISASRPGVQLSYIEVANLHGYARGLVELDIVPRGRHANTVPWWMALAIAAGFFALRPRPDWPAHRVVRRLHRSAIAGVLLVFTASVVCHLVSPYRILLSVGTFFVMAVVLYADPLTRVARRLAPPTWRLVRPLLQFIPHALVVLLVLWSVGQLHRPKTGFTSLILFGGDFESTKLPVLRDVPHWVDPGAGYDGQFYAQLAVDPFLRSHSILTALDSPAYRARRILLPWTAHLIGWGDPARVLQAYALLNVASWLVLACVLLYWLPAGTARSTMAWAACLLGQGLLSSLRQSLPDGPSALIFALAILAVERNRRWLGAALLGLAGLTRETNLLGTVLLLPRKLTGRSTAMTALQGGLAVAPLVLWMTYLWTLGFPASEAGLRNFGAPLAAYFTKWSVTLRDLQQGGWDSWARLSLLTLVAVTTQAVFFIRHRDWRSAWWQLGAVYALFMTCLGDAVWEGHPGAIGRVVVPMTVAFNVMLPRLTWPSFVPVWVLGNASVLVGLDAMDVPWVSMR